MYTVYVLKSGLDGNLYVGCTSDINRRMREHMDGMVRSTKGRRPLTLIHSEKFIDKFEAFRAEKYYKTATGKRKLKSLLKK